MNTPENTAEFIAFISDVRAAINKHAEDAATAMKRIQSPDEIRPTTDVDKMWATLLAMHTAIVNYVMDEGIRDERIRACAMVDAGMRLLLDDLRDRFVAEIEAKQKPKPNIIGLRN